MAHMAARSAASSLSRGAWAPRTIFVKASPAPLTFSERRAVLHALKQHCRIDFFRKIQNNPSSFLSLTESWEAAESLIAKSPLTYQLATDTAGRYAGSNPPNQAASPEQQQTNTAEPPAPQEANPGPSEGTKTFVIHIFPRGGNKKHTDLVQDSPLYGPWPARPDTTSFVAKNLHMSIPEGELRDGLADWETGGQLREDGDVAEREARHHFRRREQKREDRMGLSRLFRGA